MPLWKLLILNGHISRRRSLRKPRVIYVPLLPRNMVQRRVGRLYHFVLAGLVIKGGGV